MKVFAFILMLFAFFISAVFFFVCVDIIDARDANAATGPFFETSASVGALLTAFVFMIAALVAGVLLLMSLCSNKKY